MLNIDCPTRIFRQFYPELKPIKSFELIDSNSLNYLSTILDVSPKYVLFSTIVNRPSEHPLTTNSLLTFPLLKMTFEIQRDELINKDLIQLFDLLSNITLMSKDAAETYLGILDLTLE